MYPCIPCGSCGGPIQYLPQLAGCGVMCPHCGVTVQMPGGHEPQVEYVTERTERTESTQDIGWGSSASYRPKRRRQASILPSVFLGGGMAMMLYFGFLRDSRWLVVQLAYEGESVGAALWRKFSSGLDGVATSGLFAGAVMFGFGVACFVLGRKTK